MSSSRSFRIDPPHSWWRRPGKTAIIAGSLWVGAASPMACDLDVNVCHDRGRGDVQTERREYPVEIGPTVQASTESRSTLSGQPVGSRLL